MVANVLPTTILEFDQIFLVISEILTEAEDIRNAVVPGRMNMMKITKANHYNNPTLVDAYKLWTWGVSCCNKGESKGNVEFEFTEDNKFKYKLGACGEVRFDWFGDFLNNFLKGISKAREVFPTVKEKIDAMHARIKGLSDKKNEFLARIPGTGDKAKAGGAVASNLAILNRSVKISEQFLEKLEGYEAEIQ